MSFNHCLSSPKNKFESSYDKIFSEDSFEQNFAIKSDFNFKERAEQDLENLYDLSDSNHQAFDGILDDNHSVNCESLYLMHRTSSLAKEKQTVLDKY